MLHYLIRPVMAKVTQNFYDIFVFKKKNKVNLF